MSTPRTRLETTPVRRDTVCMCVHGRACSSFAPGHAVHLIQARLASATPGEWVDAIVTSTDASEGSLLLHTLDGAPVALWSGAGAADHLVVGTPVAFHPRYHALSVGGRLFNCLAL